MLISKTNTFFPFKPVFYFNSLNRLVEEHYYFMGRL